MWIWFFDTALSNLGQDHSYYSSHEFPSCLQLCILGKQAEIPQNHKTGTVHSAITSNRTDRQPAAQKGGWAVVTVTSDPKQRPYKLGFTPGYLQISNS